MHHIQRKILSLLMYAPALGYAQLRPKGVESNHFAYHLEQLLRAGLVVKEQGKYSLSTEGISLADRVSHGDITVRKQPHIVTTVCVTNDAGKMILFRHAFQPYIGRLGFPQGRLHYEEDVHAAAKRELFEKAGLDDVALDHRGMAYITAQRDGVVISRLMAHVFSGTVDGEPALVTTDAKKGQPLWQDTATSDRSYMPGFAAIREQIQNTDQLFFIELETEV